MKKQILLLSSLIIFLFVWTGCQKKDDDSVTPQTEDSTSFVSATSVGNFSSDELKVFATEAGFGSFSPLLKYDVNFYKVVYKTPFKGSPIEVSGLLAVPEGMTDAPSLISAQHGTIFKDSDAPSNFPDHVDPFSLIAPVGFVAVIPDYIGFGVSKDIPHPYYTKKYAGLTVVNMIKAAQYFLKKKGYAISKKLFLIGYSEGGYTTMAAQREIETNAVHNLKITAAAEGAGGYDLDVFMSYLTQHDTYTAPSFLTFILNGYNETYDWDRPLTDFFQEPYASRIPDVLDGTKSRSQIDDTLTDNLTNLFNPDFYADLKNPAKNMKVKEKLKENSFLNWYPKSPTRMYHGTADITVPFATSDSTFNRFERQGATNVTFIPFEGKTHTTGIEPMMSDALLWILGLN